MKKNYIIPETQIQTVSTPMPIAAGSLPVKKDDTITNSDEGGWGKINYNAWEDDLDPQTYLPDFDASLTPYSY